MSKDLSAKYYQKNNERLQNKTVQRHQDLSKEKKSKKREYGCKRYKNLLRDINQSLVEYRKKCYKL